MEYFIVANSFAAPFFSDTSHGFKEAESPEKALKLFAESYSHPCGLYSAIVFADANDYHKGNKPLAQWMCNEAKFIVGKTGLIKKPMIGKVVVDNVLHNIENPKEGAVV